MKNTKSLNLLNEEIFRISEIMSQLNNNFTINENKIGNILNEALVPKPTQLQAAGEELEVLLRKRNTEQKAEDLFKRLEPTLENLRVRLNTTNAEMALTELISKVALQTGPAMTTEKTLLRDIIKMAAEFDVQFARDASEKFYGQFVNRIKFLKNPKNIAQRVKDSSGQYVDIVSQVEREFEFYFGKNFADNLKGLYTSPSGGLKQKVFEVDFANLTPQQLKGWKKFVASKDFMIPGFRNLIGTYTKALANANVKVETLLDEAFSKIKAITEKTQNFTDLTKSSEAKALFDDIITTFTSIKTEEPVKLEDLFKSIRESLIGEGLDSEIANKISNGLEKALKDKKTALIPEFLGKTSWANAAREIKEAKGFFGKLGAYLKRQLYFLTFGSIKTFPEWKSFVLDYGNKKMGILAGYLYYQAAARIGLPLFIATVSGFLHTIGALFGASEATSFGQAFEKTWKEEYEKMFTIPDEFWTSIKDEVNGNHGKLVWGLQQLLPVHTLWPEIWNSIITAKDYVANNQLTALIGKIISFIGEKYNEGKKAAAGYVDRAKERTHDEIEKIKSGATKLTVDEIYKKFPCYLKNAQGQVSDLKYGDRGIEITGINSFSYKFNDDAVPYEVTLKDDGNYYWSDGTEFKC